MIIISDTTPLIAFLRVNRLDILGRMFGTVVIPQKVLDEIHGKPEQDCEAKIIRECSFIEVVPVSNQQAVSILMLSSNLDGGESEAIVLTKELEATTLLIDERKGRKIAESLGLNIMGTVGVLINGSLNGILSPVNAIDLIDQMRSSGIRISEKVYLQAVQRLMGLK